MTALVLAYHAVEPGPPPLCLAPEEFQRHLDVLAELAVPTLTVSALAEALRREALRREALPERAVAITFDDGCASAVRVAAPLLREHAMTATFFCVAGHLGGWNDWPTQPRAVPRLQLATRDELRELAASGFEIGAHGMDHEPLTHAGQEVARRELEDSKIALEAVTGQRVTSFAFPYGAPPSGVAAPLVSELYAAACGSRPRRVAAGFDPHALPRVDAHYLRRPAMLRRVALGRWDAYLRLRELGARARRIVASDYRPVESGNG
jgi:peptidoglycan/xylan/chitin deacetylase (PgdA/CDA1 family)